MPQVLLVEDHDMVAEAIGRALDQAEGITVVARARSIAEARAQAHQHRPDVVVLDRRLPDGDAINAIADLNAAGARVLVLTADANASVAARVAQAGGAGLLLKSSRLDELETAVRQVAAGEAAFGPGLLTGVLERLSSPAGNPLTAREQQTLVLLAAGASTDEIGERLGVTRNTVRNHVQRVLDKLDARSKLEAVVIARREGLLD
ncbi:DNA-binding response regulator [Actinophytocola xinjiangensis]|uniref:DNA-binding response regulator n=1 Tax=Actinophytocola xinjiangensis TaxID=485602 RepID=A0A7Z0WIF5_9PSEU|nr:response regulator transcription factor [Actinophytocola xinjiangensis]OLF08050.1 DNA-binding response regulator [Actinophytocola xinjiangensis]